MEHLPLIAGGLLLLIAGAALAEGLHRWFAAQTRADDLHDWFNVGYQEGFDLEPIDLHFATRFSGSDPEAANRYLKGRRAGWNARMAKLHYLKDNGGDHGTAA